MLQPTISSLSLWYQNWGSQFVEVLILFICIYTFVNYKTLRLRLNQHELEEQIRIANDEAELSSESLKRLGEVGRELTANLDSDAIFDSLRRNIESELDPSVLIIYSVCKTKHQLLPLYVWENGKRTPGNFSIDLNSPHSAAARVVTSMQEILENLNFTAEDSGTARAALNTPLVVGSECIGVISVHFSASSFSARHRQVFQSLCAYTAIALNNANNFRELNMLLGELKATQENLLGINESLMQMKSELATKNVELENAYSIQEKQKNELARFLAVASHDLRQPMQAINLYLGAFENFEVSADARHVLKNIHQCATIMEGMFKGLLDLSKLDADVVEPDSQLVLMNKILQGTRIEFEHIARQKNLQLRIVPCHSFVRTDPLLLEQILRNLVSNAIRYTSTGKILIGCRRQKAHLRLCVIDTGVGIAQEHQEHVFDEFFQIQKTAKIQGRGLGLGLAIVRRIADLLGIALNLRSQEGKGSIFSVDLDLVRMEVDPAYQLTSNVEHPMNMMLVRGKTIAIIEDESSILDSMRILLENWGARVLAANSCMHFLEQIDQLPRQPDLLICDFHLGEGMNGLESIYFLREEFNRRIPAIIITGSVAEPALCDAEENHISVLHKPLNAQDLCKVIIKNMLEKAERNHNET